VRIAKLHDELANDVYQTMAFVEMQDLSYSYNKETLLDNLDTIYSRTRNISKENSTIAMGPDYIPNLKEMISDF
jgi:bifunctional pyridoxal-dependent enzyme with beta-cystathionase and maltose regulon repressor activities